MFAPRRTSRMLRRVAMMAALAALLAPAGMAEAAKKKYPPPVVTSVSPSKVAIGETLTIRGRHFRRGVGRNSVAFKRDGFRAVMVEADISTSKLMKVIVSDKLADFLAVKDGVAQPTRFRIRILSRRFGKRFTALSKSPVILPKPPEGSDPNQPAPAAPDGDCDGDDIKNGVDTDDDNDLLSDDVEKSVGTDNCKRDTDGDGVEDGYEYQSAKDLNSTHRDGYLPYPGKKPYPNPLFADGDTDYDGDGLWLKDEYSLWISFGTRSLDVPLVYSDGRQHSRNIAAAGYDKQGKFRADSGIAEGTLLNFNGFVVPGINAEADAVSWWNPYYVDQYMGPDAVVTDVERFYFDRDYNGKLSDDELDEDADGLSNWEESHGPMTAEWWAHVYNKETPYVNTYAGTSLVDRDSDGDSVIDGVDDNDHDGLINLHEISRQLVAGEAPAGAVDWRPYAFTGEWPEDEADAAKYEAEWTYGGNPDAILWNRFNEGAGNEPITDRPMRAWVNPFNPCLPDKRSATCERHPNLSQLYAPFKAGTPQFNVYDGLWADGLYVWPE
jgi:hypothetical protein